MICGLAMARLRTQYSHCYTLSGGDSYMNGATAMAICATLTVAGCASSTLPAIDRSAMDYRQLALDHVRDHFPDAYKIQHAQIAPPRSPAGSGLVEAEEMEYSAVCLRTKVKGGRSVDSSKDTVLLIRGNLVMDAQDGIAATNFCKGAKFEPFPEIAQKL